MGRVEQRGAWPFTVRASQGHLLIPKYFFFEGIDPQILSYRDDSHVLATPTARRGRSKLSFLLLFLTGELCRLLRALERSGLIPDPRRKINHGAAYQAPGNRMNKLPQEELERKQRRVALHGVPRAEHERLLLLAEGGGGGGCIRRIPRAGTLLRPCRSFHCSQPAARLVSYPSVRLVKRPACLSRSEHS